MLADVESWTEWTTAFAVVQLQQPPPLAIGDQVFTKQPRLPGTIWAVTAVKPGVGFTWEAGGLGWVAAFSCSIEEDRVVIVRAEEDGLVGRVLRSRRAVAAFVDTFAAALEGRLKLAGVDPQV